MNTMNAHLNRRQLLTHSARFLGAATGVALLGAHAPGWAQSVTQRSASAADRILVLIELKGGNDGLNTVVPYANPQYAAMRPSLGSSSSSCMPSCVSSSFRHCVNTCA